MVEVRKSLLFSTFEIVEIKQMECILLFRERMIRTSLQQVAGVKNDHEGISVHPHPVSLIINELDQIIRSLLSVANQE